MGGSRKKIPATATTPEDAEKLAAAAAEADRLQRMNTFQWLGLQTEMAVERGLDLCAPARGKRAPRHARSARQGSRMRRCCTAPGAPRRGVVAPPALPMSGHFSAAQSQPARRARCSVTRDWR